MNNTEKMEKKKVAVIANGQWDEGSWGQQALAPSQIHWLIAADGGANHAISSGRIPDVLIGDLDSISPENLSLCLANQTKIIRYPSEKDQTDLELAVEAAHSYLQANDGVDEAILLYGAGGKRLDHLLGNIALMLGYAQKKRTVRMVDHGHQAWVMLTGTQVLRGMKGQELSLIPLSEKACVSSEGLYYPLTQLALYQNCARGISNVFESEQATIQVHQGTILVVVLQQDMAENI